MGGGVVDLKTLGPEHHVRAMTFCQDTFRVTTADGNTRAFWERNLRLKVDSSNAGPEKGTLALFAAHEFFNLSDERQQVEPAPQVKF